MAARAGDGVNDIDAECIRLFFAQGAILANLVFPFMKALGALGRKYPEELLALWKKELEAPMPFGLPPVGLPKED